MPQGGVSAKMHSMTLIQLALVSLFAFSLSRVYLRAKERSLGPLEVLFWSLLWLVGILVILYPSLTISFAHFFGVGRGSDLVIYFSIAFIFYLLYRLFVGLEALSRKLDFFIRLYSKDRAKKP